MSDPSEILKRRLQSVVDGVAEARGLHFFCQIGGTYHDYGMLTLQVSGEGRLLLGWRRDDDEQELYSLKLQESDWSRFYELLLELPFWECNPARRTRRNDDELNVHIRLSDQVAGTWSGVQFWSQDMSEFSVLERLMHRIERITLAISGGEIPYPNWEEANAPA